MLDHSELMSLMLPIPRADFEIAESYSYVPGEPLTYPISSYGGLRDPDVSREGTELWRNHCTASFALKIFPSALFFIHSEQSLLLSEVEREIEAILRSVI